MSFEKSSCFITFKIVSKFWCRFSLLELSRLLVPPGKRQLEFLADNIEVSLLEVSLNVMGTDRFASMPHLPINILCLKNGFNFIMNRNFLSCSILESKSAFIMTHVDIIIQILDGSNRFHYIHINVCTIFDKKNALYETTHMLSMQYSLLYFIFNICVNQPRSGDLQRYSG